MSIAQQSEDILFRHLHLDQAKSIVNETLRQSDDGELYLEYTQREKIIVEDGVVIDTAHMTDQGFGLRSVIGEAVAFAHASDLSDEALRRAQKVMQGLEGHKTPRLDVTTPLASKALYQADNPLLGYTLSQKIALLNDINAFIIALDSRIKSVNIGLMGEWKVVGILKVDGVYTADIRPLIRMNINVVAQAGTRQEAGVFGLGGRYGYDHFFKTENWQHAAREAVRQAVVNLDAKPAPAGEMTVVLGNGWPGILLHEAIGHGLEGDFNRKKTSAFSELMHQQVAAKGITVVDDGTLPNRRGSLTIDDEGTTTQCTVLIEDGILKNYMQDRMNARLMNTRSTGNGRRESYAFPPFPRMTNTYMRNGKHSPEEIIQSVKKGLYAVNFGGGQVDISSGQFVFSAVEAYLIEDGRITTPVKDATLIGNGPEVLKHVTMIGNDSTLDTGIGTCGKNGQGVPVGVGQPTLKISNLTVGGTQVA
ncbi:MAG: metalloprotease TldD [Candidatus Nucleicultricaceae bacterium]